VNKYFIDCGAHCGESILRARQQFGRDIAIISFEAVPSLAEELIKLYENDPLVSICNAAVYVKDGDIELKICPAFTDGSSILSTLNDNYKAKKIKIPCFDLSNWIKHAFSEGDYVILKLDIEGAEYDVLEKLIKDNTISLIDELWGEWHYNHIIRNISQNDAKILSERDNLIRAKLKELNKELKIWEAYYYDSPLLAKRPTTLYE
jgi:FkbM family methyltransferase